MSWSEYDAERAAFAQVIGGQKCPGALACWHIYNAEYWRRRNAGLGLDRLPFDYFADDRRDVRRLYSRPSNLTS